MMIANFPKLIIDGNDIGIVIDIQNGLLHQTGPYGLHLNRIQEGTIELLCEKLFLERISPNKLLESYKKIKENDPIIQEGPCSICLEKFEVGCFKRTLKCNHTFHKKCVDKWIHKEKTCPICRTNPYNS
jgi:hypothetical protein